MNTVHARYDAKQATAKAGDTCAPAESVLKRGRNALADRAIQKINASDRFTFDVVKKAIAERLTRR